VTQSTPALIELIMQASGVPTTNTAGEVKIVPDNDMVMYRLMDIPSDNYAAFLKEAKEFLNTAVQLENKVRTVSYDRILKEVMAIERYYNISITGKSSENGKLIKELLKDETLQRHIYKEEGGKGVLEKFASSQGDNEQRGRQHQQ